MSAIGPNFLLDALTVLDRECILAASKHVELAIRKRLFEAEEQPTFAYFLTSGVASVVVTLTGGHSIEAGLIGREGVVGGLELIGPAFPASRCFMQVAGAGYRIRFSDLKRIFRTSAVVRERILEAVQQQGISTAQLAACNKAHEIEARLARWLLTVQDRVQDSKLYLTQEFLAEMLGTQRTTVVLAAGELQRRGMTDNGRGWIQVIDRQALTGLACECYHVGKRLFDNLYTKPTASQLEVSRTDGAG